MVIPCLSDNNSPQLHPQVGFKVNKTAWHIPAAPQHGPENTGALTVLEPGSVVRPYTKQWLYMLNRRKFKSQTSDSMDRWKSKGGKSQRREEKKREDQRRERVRRKKMQAHEKVAKPRFTMFFQ